MEEDRNSPSAIAPAPSGGGRLLALGQAAVPALALVAMTSLLVPIFALRGEVAALENQARESAMATKALRTALADIQASLPEPEAPVVEKRYPAPRPPLRAAYAASARPVKVQAPAPRRVCVFRPGEGGSLASCIKLGT